MKLLYFRGKTLKTYSQLACVAGVWALSHTLGRRANQTWYWLEKQRLPHQMAVFIYPMIMPWSRGESPLLYVLQFAPGPGTCLTHPSFHHPAVQMGTPSHFCWMHSVVDIGFGCLFRLYSGHAKTGRAWSGIKSASAKLICQKFFLVFEPAEWIYTGWVPSVPWPWHFWVHFPLP